jgi:hypothetical protein
MSTYLVIRALHVLTGALWVGVAVFSAWWLVPLAKDLGPDAGKVTASLQRRGYIVAVPVIALTGILSGLWLYWRFTGGFSPDASRTPAAMIFGTGGMLAILAFLVGVIVIRPAMARATAMAREAAGSTNENDRRRLMAAAEALRGRAGTAGSLVAVLLVLTVILMSIAHYV